MDYDQMLIKVHQQGNKKCGKTIPQLGTQQKELHPLVAPKLQDQHMVEFLQETGLTLELAEGRMEDIPRAEVVVVPYKHGEPFVTQEEEITLGMQMFNFHKLYLQKLKEE